MLRPFLAIFVALALAVTVAYRESFFATPYHEEGDDAANALQIENAKRFRELHGNYSRWEFHHPGPAFFYAYALGEWLLYDVTGIAPAPRNAHVYAAFLVQLAFYAAAIALLARQTSRPWTVAGLAVALAALHYSQVQRVFYSTWPPDVLLMPFLCFVVACAACAARDRLALPIMVLAGSFLVHGHVAQPLFVVVMALVALAATIDFQYRRWRELLRGPYHFVTAALLAVFLLPLVIDAFAGRESNLYDISLHFKTQGGGGQAFLPSLLFYGAYYGGFPNPGWFDDPASGTELRFVGHVWLLVLWLALLAAAAWWFFRPAHRRDPAPDLRFGRALLGFWLLGGALAVVWAMKQDGGFTSYNSQFAHSLAHVLLLAGIVMAVRIAPAVSPLVCAAGGAAAVAAFVLALPIYAPSTSRSSDLAVRLTALLAADPKPNSPKLLQFSGDSWYDAVTLARALQLRGLETYVDAWSKTMYGRKRVVSREEMLSHDNPSVWRIYREAEAPAGAHVLVAGYSRVVFPPAPDVGALPLRVDFTQAGSDRPVLIGIGGTEEDFTWTFGRVAALEFQSPDVAQPVAFTLEASGATSRENRRGQRVRLSVNGTLLGEHLFPATPQRATFAIPASVWNARSPRLITLGLPDAIAPVDVSDSGDRRPLALRLQRMTFESPPP